MTFLASRYRRGCKRHYPPGRIAFYISTSCFGRVLARRVGLGTLGAIPLRHIALILFAFSISTERERLEISEAQAKVANAQPQPYDPLANL